MLKQRDLKLDAVVNFSIPDSLLVDRITGRRVHKASGRSYHVKFNPPKEEGKDDVRAGLHPPAAPPLPRLRCCRPQITGEPLMQRPDDRADVLGKRLEAYHRQTKPVLDFYSKKDLVSNINANAPISKVWGQLSSALGNPNK